MLHGAVPVYGTTYAPAPEATGEPYDLKPDSNSRSAAFPTFPSRSVTYEEILPAVAGCKFLIPVLAHLSAISHSSPCKVPQNAQASM